METSARCRDCSAQLPVGSRFCPNCGTKTTRTPLSFARIATTATLGFGLCGASLGISTLIQRAEGRTKPSQPFTREHLATTEGHADGAQSPHPPMGPKAPDPALDPLRARAAAEPKRIEVLKELGIALAARGRTEDPSAMQYALEAVDVLGRALDIAPNDPVVLVQLGDVSFDRKVFAKAKEYYGRYLEINGEDDSVRARHASALTFIGEVDNAVKELQGILARNPSHFHGAAYLAIAYAQLGNREESIRYGEQALRLAPSEEAMKRFGAFLESVKGAPNGDSAPVAPAGGASSPATDPIGSFITGIRSNPVAGPKFVRHEVRDGDAIALIFRDFPMDAMPPFAKEKFFGGLQERVPPSVRLLLFVDDATGREMARLEVRRGPQELDSP